MSKYNKWMFTWSVAMIATCAGMGLAGGCAPAWCGFAIAWWISFAMFIYNMVRHIMWSRGN